MWSLTVQRRRRRRRRKLKRKVEGYEIMEGKGEDREGKVRRRRTEEKRSIK